MEFDLENRTIYMKDIDRTIHYKDPELLLKMEKYIHNIDIFNQILPDFTYE